MQVPLNGRTLIVTGALTDLEQAVADAPARPANPL